MIHSFQKIFKSNRSQRIYVIAKHDFLQRYYGSALGVFWAFLNPLLRILIYFLVFKYLIFKNNDPNFILYLFLGILPWSFFSETSKKGMKVLFNKRHLIENIQINKYDLFTSHVLSTLFAFIINLSVYFVFRIFFNVDYSFHSIWAIILIINLALLGYAISLLLSTLFIFVRDLDHVWDIILMAGFWSVPIIWDQKFIFEVYQFMLYLTPITGIIINLREVLLYNSQPHLDLLIYDLIYTATLFSIAIFFFKKYAQLAIERR